MYWIAGGVWMCDDCGLKKPCKCDRGGENLMERYYTEKRQKAEEQERYIRELEAENKRLLKAENKRLREALEYYCQCLCESDEEEICDVCFIMQVLEEGGD